jgi:uncharacterized protein YndB with AHSA1/START domain
MNLTGSRVEVRRRLSAEVERVFAAFATPEAVAMWLTPAPEVKLSVLEFDFREGGMYRFAYDVPDGRRMIVGGSYRVIEPPTRIVFSWLIASPDEHAGIESEVTVTITPIANGSELVIHHDKFGRPDAEARHAEGWRGAVEQLEALLINTEERDGNR